MPFVDEVKSATGDSSVFQRMNEQGDMMRVATTATDRRGQRALGTYIPAVGLDGSPSPVIESILRGKPFQGHSNVLGTTFVTAFEPFTDPGGKVLGMLAVGEHHSNRCGA
jgi:methyl-accepting chemotaxis protein